MLQNDTLLLSLVIRLSSYFSLEAWSLYLFSTLAITRLVRHSFILYYFFLRIISICLSIVPLSFMFMREDLFFPLYHYFSFVYVETIHDSDHVSDEDSRQSVVSITSYSSGGSLYLPAWDRFPLWTVWPLSLRKAVTNVFGILAELYISSYPF